MSITDTGQLVFIFSPFSSHNPSNRLFFLFLISFALAAVPEDDAPLPDEVVEFESLDGDTLLLQTPPLRKQLKRDFKDPAKRNGHSVTQLAGPQRAATLSNGAVVFSTAEVIGITVGIVIFGALAFLGLFVLFRRRQQNHGDYKTMDSSVSLTLVQKGTLGLVASFFLLGAAGACAAMLVTSSSSSNMLFVARAGAIDPFDVTYHSVTNHNLKRNTCTLNPPASSMPALAWDAASASVAISWVNTCPTGHNPNRGNRGENIYFYSAAGVLPQAAIEAAVKAWFNENVSYTFTTNTCASGKVCGHYTQLVWAKSTLLGCGVKTDCAGTWKTIVVCNYAAPGNFVGEWPYVKGAACPNPNAHYTDYSTTYEQLSWSTSDSATFMSGLGKRDPSNNYKIIVAPNTPAVPPTTTTAIYAAASSDASRFAQVRVGGGAVNLQIAATATTPAWVSLSGLSFIASETGFTNLVLNNGLVLYSASFNTPGVMHDTVANSVYLRGLIKTMATQTVNPVVAASNLPLHGARDIFVCMGSNGPARCDVGTTSVYLYRPFVSPTVWTSTSWYSIDGIISFPSSTGFANLSLVGGKTAYGGLYSAPSSAVMGAIVYLRGLVKTSAATSSVIATLPTGQLPQRRHVFLQACGTTICRVDVAADGQILVVSPAFVAGAAAPWPWVSLAGIHFPGIPQFIPTI
jgi:hypothetical protein